MARSLKPSYMPSNEARNSAVSASSSAPAIRRTTFANACAPKLVTFSVLRPAAAPGASTHRRNRPPRKSVRRRGASRKDRADRVGGVSITIASWSPSSTSS